ncbi:hypothetical protein [Aquimarina sp. AU474]|uniref:hypothetical protein n=1 Tax=Aquimarina sp. AU474 TaxID=2108529 RepID=UPI000D68FB9F|nr:hypothetical protein [Aquimarina sp. AU474]
MENTNKLPAWYWVVSIVAFIWNIIGVLAYIAQAYMTEEALAAMPEGDQNFYNNMPAWVTGVFAIAVFGGTLACIGLILKKKWAYLLFLVSLIAVLAQAIYNFFLQDYVSLSGPRIMMPLLIIIVALFLVWFSKKAIAKDWIS